MQTDVARKRRNHLFQREPDTHVTSYKRFRTWLSHKHSRESPAVSTPLSTGRRCGPNFELDDVVQRLELDSPSRFHAAAQRVVYQESTLILGNSSRPPKAQCIPNSGRYSVMFNVPEQEWIWIEHKGGDAQSTEIQSDPRPFSVLSTSVASPLGNSTLKLAAPSLVNDYYTHLLDYSCNGILALALDSSVYIWNSETRSLLGRLDPSPETGRKRRQTVSCVRWSGDGHVLSIGTRRGEVQLWDVERRQNVKTLPSHLSVVRALSWKQQLLSSGSTLGHIHHNDPRAPSPLVGTVIQQEGLCSLQWSPGGEWLASGSADGLLHIWDRDVTGSHRPVATMKQPSAVKAMGWCPWKGNVIATGGGWKDGQLRIWDIESATCVGSADTNSQICSLGWAEVTRRLVTGHGHPHHNAICWDLEFPSLRPAFHLTGHSRRILHVALNNDAGQLFTAGADQCLHMWDMSFPQSLLS
ncbi:cell division cycle protein 20 homolog B-like isoform X2 [Phyllopteryx taeniolatus]|uniref:cell division cycle protein 20 homolog B-like isoform X2 n=1 Tax=Phyllopteryx taeniolatus TaxID=161469 RepID=UPI002AD4C6BA|nr:cell division cycle protein 20 homolog B-like isoform X2 [Phyllopteryx taeniolatus]